MERYLSNVELITKNAGIQSLPFETDIIKALLVFLPLSTDFDSIVKFYANQKHADDDDEQDLESSKLVVERYNAVKKFVDHRCDELGFKEYSISEFLKSRLVMLDLSLKETSLILEQIIDVDEELRNWYDELRNWYDELILPLVRSGVNISTSEVSRLNEYEIMKLLLANFNNDTDILNKDIVFISKHWNLFIQWFEEYSELNLLTGDKFQLIKNYEVLLLSIFENDEFLDKFIKVAEFDQFVSVLFGCFYLCPVVNERIFIVIKSILFIISQRVETGEEVEFNEVEVSSLREISGKLTIQSLPYLNKLITSVEKLYQLEISIKGIIKMIENYEEQFSNLNKLIDINMKDDLTQLYNSISWIHTNTQFFNKVSKKELDFIFFNRLIKLKKYSTLESLMDKLEIEDLSNLILKDFYDNFNQSSNFNPNSHHLQNCSRDLSLLANVNQHGCTKLTRLLDSFKILNNFKISNNVIKPSDILNSTTLEIVDRLFELNEDVDIFEIYELSTNLAVGLDDELQNEFTGTDAVYEYKHLSTTKDRILVRILLIDLKYSITNKEVNYNTIINLLSNENMSDLLLENWFIIYQYINYQSQDADLTADEEDEVRQIENLSKVLKIISLFILLVPIEFNNRITQNFMQLMNELNDKITRLQASNLSGDTRPKMDLESRIARAFTSSTKDILKDLLV